MRRTKASIVGATPAPPRWSGRRYAPLADGYWLVAADGGVFSFGAAAFHGSMGGQAPQRPVVGMAATPDGGGYWLVAADGGVFSFGDAASTARWAAGPERPGRRHGSAPDGGGYWLVAADGGVFSFGDAVYHGSMGGRHRTRPDRRHGVLARRRGLLARNHGQEPTAPALGCALGAGRVR